MNLSEIVTGVIRVARAGNTISKDESWHEELLAHYVEQWRAKLVYQQAYAQSDAFSHIDPSLLQSVFPLQLSKIDKSETPNLPWGCNILKVTGILFENVLYPIENNSFPAIVDLRDMPAISFFGNVDKQTSYFYTTSAQLRYKISTAFGASFGWYYMIGNNIYVVPPATERNICFVAMTAVFQSPRDVMSMLTGFTVPKTDDSFWQAEYPLSPTILSLIEQSIIEGEFKSMLSTVSAVSNASAGVQEIIQEQRQIG